MPSARARDRARRGRARASSRRARDERSSIDVPAGRPLRSRSRDALATARVARSARRRRSISFARAAIVRASTIGCSTLAASSSGRATSDGRAAARRRARRRRSPRRELARSARRIAAHRARRATTHAAGAARSTDHAGARSCCRPRDRQGSTASPRIDGPAIAALVASDAACFVHDPDARHSVLAAHHDLAPARGAAAKARSAASVARQQLDELRSSRRSPSGRRCSATPVEALAPAGAGDPAERLAAWLLTTERLMA